MTPEEAFSEANKRIKVALESRASSLSLYNLPLGSLPPEIELVAESLQELQIGELRIDVANNHELVYDLREDEIQPRTRLDTSSLARISTLRNLKLLSMAGAEALGDLTWISPLGRLESAHVCGLYDDITPLEKLKQLRHLTIHSIRTSDLSPLKNLTQLRTLSLAGDGVCGLESLANLTNLEKLSLDGGDMADYRPLAELTKLNSLSLRSDAQRDLGPLANLHHLESLILCDGQIEDLTPISHLPSLRRIFFQWGGTSDIRPLISIPRLEEIRLDDCYHVTEIPPELVSRITSRSGV